MVKFETAFILKEKIYEAIGRIKEGYPRVASHSKDALAIKVYPPSSKELTFTYVDWNPSPPDNNTGIWNKVFIKSSGPVTLRCPHVISKLKIPSSDRAALTVTAELTNSSSSLIQGTLKGKIESIQFYQDVSLSPGERKMVTFDPALYTQLNISNPRVW